MKIPEKLLKITPYDPSAEQFDVKLDANENAVTVPEEIRKAAMQAIAKLEWNRYPDPGCTALKNAAAKVYGVKAENVGVGVGSDEILSILMNNFLDEGDTVVMSSIDFSMYAFYAANAGLHAEKVELNFMLGLTADRILDAVRRTHASMVLFSNPCNPTGQGLEAEDVRRIVREADCLVVVDEAYMDFWDQSIAAEAEQYPNLIVLRTCSKAFGLAALRCGFFIANRTLTELYDRVRSPYNVNALTQAAATAALECSEILDNMTQACIRRANSLRLMARGLCAEHAQYLEYLPTVTNFVLLKPLGTNGLTASACFAALRAKRIGVRLLKDTYLRVTAGTDAENSAVILALDEIIRGAEKNQ